MSQATLADRPYVNSNLFSGHYLDERLHDREEWDCDDAAREALSELQELYELEGNLVSGYKEDALIDNWIDEVLDVLGYGTQDEVTLPAGGGFVDELLFETPSARRDAAKVYLDTENTTDLFERGIGLVEAKQWDADFTTRFSEQRPYRNASHQIKHYLENTPANIQWGVLTNGRKWRLYGTNNYETQTYYEVDLPELLERGDLEAFKYFYVFFRPSAFHESGGTTFLDEVWSESETASQELGEDLQDNVFTALRVLGKGFVETNDDLDIDPDDEEALAELKEQSLVLLYRLMFVLYAEARGLIHPENQAAQDDYEENFSLNELRIEIHDAIGEVDEGFEEEFSAYSTSMWSRLEDLFRLIDQGEEDLGIPPYNGGLFNHDDHSFLTEHEVNNQYLAEVIYRLSTAKNDEGRYVLADYADLDTRHLGSVYEGLLEHQFRIAPEQYAAISEDGGQVWKPATEVSVADAVETVPEGGLYVVNDEGERKATGSYYTPDYVVTYIVEETVGPLVEEIREDLIDQGFEPGTQEYIGPFFRRVTDLRILDPAMGSGHFLTKATGYLSEQVMSEVRETESEFGVAFDERHVRREITKECIYGVDLNGMAVELAKLSMWLETLAADRPLAFLDHHFKQGNSLVGSDIGAIEELESDASEDDDSQASLAEFGATREGTIERLMDIYSEFLAIENETVEDVHEMKRKYAEIEQDELRKRLVAMANVHTAERFDIDVPSGAYERMAKALEDDGNWDAVAETDWFEAAQTLADDEDFHHWKLEFPEVFFGEEGEQLSDAGFDVVLGNPPYVPIQGLEERHTGYYNSAYDSAFGNYDLYVLFVEKGLDILNTTGKFGYILPNKLFQVDYGENLRAHLASEGLVSEVIDFGSNQVFAEAATTYTALLFLDAGQQREQLTYSQLADDSDPASLAWKEDSSDWEETTFAHDTLSESPWNFHRQEIQSIIEAAEDKAVPLEKITASIGRGSSTGCDVVFEMQVERSENDLRYCTSDVTEGAVPIESSALRKPIHSTDFDKYLFEGTDNKCLIWPYDSDYNLLTEAEFSSRHPHTWEYLQNHREQLEERANYSNWYDYSAPRNLGIHDRGEILVPLLADEPSFAPYPENQSNYVLVASGGFGISLRVDTDYSPMYVLALINSRLLFLCLRSISNVFRGGYITCTKQYFRELPIREISFDTDNEEREASLESAIEFYHSGLSGADFTDLLSYVEKCLREGKESVIHDLLGSLAGKMVDLRADRREINLTLLDYIRPYSDGPSLTDIGTYQPPKGVGDTKLTATTEDYDNIRIGSVTCERKTDDTVVINATARYKPEDEDDHETDQWGYTETEPIPALRLTELTETEADLVEAFVPVAADEAGGFANFRETATKTNSLVDRLEAMTLPDPDDVADGLQRYIEAKERAEELDAKIERTDDLIDEIVYELYGLTDEEIEIVESAVEE